MGSDASSFEIDKTMMRRTPAAAEENRRSQRDRHARCARSMRGRHQNDRLTDKSTWLNIFSEELCHEGSRRSTVLLFDPCCYLPIDNRQQHRTLLTLPKGAIGFYINKRKLANEHSTIAAIRSCRHDTASSLTCILGSSSVVHLSSYDSFRIFLGWW